MLDVHDLRERRRVDRRSGTSSDDPTCASVWRSSDTVENFGSSRSSSASCGENGSNWFDDRVKSARSTSSSVFAAEALSDAANTETNATSPSPIISADAVDAVRRGFRLAFSPPSRPGAERRNGRPITAASPRGEQRRQLRDPEERQRRAKPDEAARVATRRRTARGRSRRSRRPVTMLPTMTRRRIDALGATLSRSASTGATRDARRAGGQAAAIVTPMPITIDTTIVRGSIDQAPWAAASARTRRAAPSARRRAAHPRPMPEDRTDQADRDRLDQDGRQHLSPARAQRSEQRELAGALRHHDVEHVEDDECADEQRDEPEDQEERPDEPEARRSPGPAAALRPRRPVIASNPFGSTAATRGAS